jgi:hypothetical protein
LGICVLPKNSKKFLNFQDVLKNVERFYILTKIFLSFPSLN